MNLMVAEMRRSLKELDLGLKGELTINGDMEALSDSLFFDEVMNKLTTFYLYSGPSIMDQAGICLAQWSLCLVCRSLAQNQGGEVKQKYLII